MSDDTTPEFPDGDTEGVLGEPASGESLTDDVSKVASSASRGAQLGTKLGGAHGAAIGAVAGGSMGALRSKRGRRLVLLALVPQIAMLVGFILMTTSVLTIVTDTDSAASATEWNKARAAAERDGVTSAASDLAASAAEGTAVPPLVIMASAKESGVSLDGEPEQYDDEAKTDAKQEGTPLGPHAFVYHDTVDLAEKLGLGKPAFEDLLDPYKSSRLYARILGLLANRDKVPTPLNLGVGVVSVDTDDEAELPDTATAGDGEESVASETGDDSATHDTYQLSDNPNDQAEAEKVKDDWVDILGDTPVEAASERAERIYDQAFQWYLGESGGCLPGSATGAASGQWANPIAAIGPPDGYGVFGPRPTSIGGGSGYHDGVDLNGTAGEGSPVYAAGSGIVTVVDSEGYGPNWVKIDHGGGIVTEYGHMASATVTTGAQVGAGTQIGTEGNMGTWSSGAHLHFSVSWPAQAADAASRGYVDPEAFFAEHGITLGSDVVGVVVGGGDPTTGTGTAPPSQVAADEVRIVQANIKTTTPLSTYNKHVDQVVAMAPDFISFNEVSSRTPEQITPDGYASYRDVPVYPAGESRGTAVAWRTDKWTMSDKGRIRLTESPVRIDNRWATWVTVTGSGGNQVSFVSVHAMTNPRLYGPNKPARQANYRLGMENLNSLIDALSVRGAVFVAGDFNSRLSHDDPWGPEVMLAASGMKSSFDLLGSVPAGVSIDYVFAQPGAGVTALRHGSWSLPDHPALWADFKLGTTVGDGSVSPVGNGSALPSSWVARPSSGSPVTLTSKQLGYAAQIAAVGAQMGVSDDAVVVAFMTVLVESKFQMYASDVYPETVEMPHDAVGSDHDSVGLFQQRPESGWGSASSLMSVEYSAKAFFGGPGGPNGGSPRGLLDVAGWESMPKGTAAQSVQVSAFPDKYALWESAATELLALVGGTTVATSACGAATGTGGTSFTLATFNVLGNSHTEPGGNKAHLGFDQYGPRLDSAVSYLSEYGVSVVGLQEFEPVQNRYFVDNYSGAWDVWPKNTNMTDAVAWRTDEWTFVSGDTFTIPYFGGNPKPMPYVKLRNNTTNLESYVVNVHNPADVQGNAAGYRATALVREKELVAELGADGSDVFLVGDFNDVDEPHCALTPELTSAFGAGSTAPCRAPDAVHIDQIFGAGASTLSSGTQHPETNNRATSDHPLVTATVTTLGSSSSSYDLGAVHPDAAAVANLLGPMFNIETVGGIGVRSQPTCHTEGLGLDFMVPLNAAGKAQGQQLADYAAAHAVELKINAVIWYQQIWSQAHAAEGWRGMEDRGDPTQNHMDHVHLSIAPCEL